MSKINGCFDFIRSSSNDLSAFNSIRFGRWLRNYGNIHLYLNEISSNKTEFYEFTILFLRSYFFCHCCFACACAYALSLTLHHHPIQFVCIYDRYSECEQLVWPFAIYVKISTRYERKAWRWVWRYGELRDKIRTRYKSDH